MSTSSRENGLMDFDLGVAMDLAAKGVAVNNGKLLLTRDGDSYKLCDRELDIRLLSSLEDNYLSGWRISNEC